MAKETEEEVTETEEVTVDEIPEEESESARYFRLRQESKAKAAVTMAAEAKEALKAKQKRLKGSPEVEGLADFHKRAAEVEKQINANPPKED